MIGRNIARLTLCLLVVGILSLLLWAGSRHNAKLSRIRHFPQIKAITIYGEFFDSSTCLDTTMRTALLFFHPECEYCQIELDGILAQHSDCRNVQWIFISLAPAEVIEEYLSETPLELIPNAYIVREDWPDTYELFGVKGPPALFIYDETGNLMKRYMGATSVKTIVQELQ